MLLLIFQTHIFDNNRKHQERKKYLNTTNSNNDQSTIISDLLCREFMDSIKNVYSVFKRQVMENNNSDAVNKIDDIRDVITTNYVNDSIIWWFLIS